MFTRISRVFAATLSLLFVLGIAVYAQNQPLKPRVPGQRQGITGRQGAQNFVPDRARQRGRALANPERLLRPPTMRELRRIAIAIGLTEQQKQDLRRIHEEFTAEVKPVLQDRREAMRELLRIMSDPTPNRGDFESATNRIARADNAILDAEFDFWAKFRSTLRDDQQARLTQFMRRRAMAGGANQQRQLGMPRNQAPALPK